MGLGDLAHGIVSTTPRLAVPLVPLCGQLDSHCTEVGRVGVATEDRRRLIPVLTASPDAL